MIPEFGTMIKMFTVFSIKPAYFLLFLAAKKFELLFSKITLSKG